MISRHIVAQKATDDGVDSLYVERDYVLAHIVAQLHKAAPADGGELIFKGGTALRFVHLGAEYRYSADLDFTVRNGSEADALAALATAVDGAREHAAFPVLQLSEDEKPDVLYVGPLGAKPRRIKVDIATNEYVESVEKLVMLPIWNDLPEPVPFSVYPLREIAAEKLRCVIQRLQCRDLFDIYQLTDGLGMDLADIRPLFEEKARSKSIDPAVFGQRFEERLPEYERRWGREIGDHLPGEPPRFDGVIRVVRRHLRSADLL